jgi:hypothetical protein
MFKIIPNYKGIRGEAKFCCMTGTVVAPDCTGELEGCTVVWTSHMDIETPFQLAKRRGDKRGNVFRYTYCIKMMQMRR